MILNWEENLGDDEMPPRWMWHLPWELKRHMERVIAKRAEKIRNPNADHDETDPNAETWQATDDDVQAWIAENSGT